MSRTEEVAASHPTRVRDSQCVGANKWKDRQKTVALPQPKICRQTDGNRVEVVGAVAVDNSLGITGGAAGVAHRCRGAFVDLRPFEVRLLRGEQLLVTQDVPQDRRVPRSDHHEGAY